MRVLVEPVRLDVDVVHHARDLGLAPALLDVQVADDVGPTLAAVGDAGRVKAADRALVAAAWVVNRVPPPEEPFEPGLWAAMVAEKPPPNEAV